MARLTPYIGKSHDRLSDLIKNSQAKPLPSAVLFEFKDATAVVSDQIGETKITVTPELYGKKAPAQELKYLRLSLDVLWELPAGSTLPIENIVWPTSLHELLPVVNECLGLTLETSEVADYPITEKPANLALTFDENNLAWIPGTYFVPVDFTLPEGVRIVETQGMRIVETGAIRIITD